MASEQDLPVTEFPGDVPRSWSSVNSSDTRAAWFVLGDREKWRTLQWLPDIPPVPEAPAPTGDFSHRQLDRRLLQVLALAAVGAILGLFASLLFLVAAAAGALEWKHVAARPGRNDLVRRVALLFGVVVVALLSISAALFGGSSAARTWLILAALVTVGGSGWLAWRHRESVVHDNEAIDALRHQYESDLEKYESRSRNRAAVLQRRLDIEAERAKLPIECVSPTEMFRVRANGLSRLWLKVVEALDLASDEATSVAVSPGRRVVTVSASIKPPQRYPRPVVRIDQADTNVPGEVPVASGQELIAHQYDVAITLVLDRGLCRVAAKYDSVDDDSTVLSQEMLAWKSIASVSRRATEFDHRQDEVHLETMGGTKHRIAGEPSFDRVYLSSMPTVVVPRFGQPNDPFRVPDLSSFVREVQSRVSSANSSS